MTAPLDRSNNLSLDSGLGGQRKFKKHKVLPRPHNDRGYDYIHNSRTGPKNYDLTINTSRPAGRDESFRIRGGTQPSSPRTLKHQPRKIGSGPDLPPTPPRHSRKSSSNLSGLPSSPTFGETSFQTPRDAGPRPPTTPPNQRSPPTPDVTPPHAASRPGLLRPVLGDRTVSKATTAGSHTGSGSFKTAREEPFSSEDEEKKSAATKTSVSTVRHISDKRSTQLPLTGLGLALISLAAQDDNRISRGDFSTFDGDWSSVSEVEEEWDNNLMRMVTIRKRPETVDAARPVSQTAIIVDPDMVSPTQATKAVRHIPLHRKLDTVSSTKGVSDRATTSTAPSSTATSISSDAKRASAISTKSTKSTKSTVSTVVEAILVDGPPQPQRQRTLRHVRKQVALRAPVNDSSSHLDSSSKIDQPSREPRVRRRPEDVNVESYVSNTTSNSISSGKARREVWRNGGIPVVIVPDRRSSNKSRSREPSLRSRSSRRTPSVGSVPRDGSVAREAKEEAKDVTVADTTSTRQSRRDRAHSESDGSDQRTLDFPPVIPTRSSSLSAPTSRNASRSASRSASRAGSLTSESIRIHNALQESLMKKTEERSQVPVLRLPDEKPSRPICSVESEKEASRRRLSSSLNSDKDTAQRRLSSSLISDRDAAQRRLSSGHNSERDGAQRRLSIGHISDKDAVQRRLSGDHQTEFLNVKSYGSLKTPFSLASVETNGTALEVSEAMAVQMYPHQNSSVLMVDHSNKPSQSSIETPQEAEHEMPVEQATTKNPADDGPLTPPQPLFSFNDVDSPLRNPRAPPEPPSHPPAIHFIPATPSGMTPADERMVQMGNYFESMKEKPPRRPSIVRRALSRRRRHSVDYPPTSPRVHDLLTRTLSLSRHVRHGHHMRSLRTKTYPAMEHEPAYPSPDDEPAEGNKLHPFWRPQWEEDGYDLHDHHGPDELDKVYKYPPINNRPHRKLSSRVKRTFAILPPREEEHYYADDQWGPERRTIRRTPSGNLRVMRHRSSLDSLRRSYHFDGGVQMVTEGEDKKPFWLRNTMHRRHSKERRRLSLGSRLEEIQNIPRKISEKRREKRSRELRQKISGPREVRDGVGDVIRSRSFRDEHHPDGQV